MGCWKAHPHGQEGAKRCHDRGIPVPQSETGAPVPAPRLSQGSPCPMCQGTTSTRSQQGGSRSHATEWGHCSGCRACGGVQGRAFQECIELTRGCLREVMKVGNGGDWGGFGRNNCGKTEREGEKRSQPCANRHWGGCLSSHACTWPAQSVLASH